MAWAGLTQANVLFIIFLAGDNHSIMSNNILFLGTVLGERIVRFSLSLISVWSGRGDGWQRRMSPL